MAKSSLSLKNKRILQIIPSLDQGGAEKGTLEVASALLKAGARSFVASSGGALVSPLEAEGSVHFELPLASKNPLTLARNSLRLQALIQRHGIHLLHARSRAPAWSALWAARALNLPLVTTFHGTYTFKNSVKKYYNSVMVRGNRVIAISEFIRHHILDHYKTYINPQHLITIPRGADLSVFNPFQKNLPARVQKLKHAWNISPEAFPVILLPGRLTRWKGQATALRALSLLKEFKGILVFLGSDQGRTAYKNELSALAHTLGLAERLRLVSHCADMAAAYKVADVVLHTSIEPEAFGRVIAEAQAMGRCVIATTHGAPGEIIEQGITGFLTPPRDAEALAKTLREFLLASPERRKEIEHKAICRVQQRFSIEYMTEKTLEVYTSLLKEFEILA